MNKLLILLLALPPAALFAQSCQAPLSCDGTRIWLDTPLGASSLQPSVAFINRLNLVGNLQLVSLGPPATHAVPATNGAGVLTGVYYYKIAFQDPYGNYSSLSPISAPVTTSSSQVQLTSMPIGPYGTSYRRVYRTLSSAASTSTYYYVGALVNNVSTTFNDNIPDSSLILAAPTQDETGACISNGATTVECFNATGTVTLGTALIGGTVTLSSINGSIQCLHASAAGVISGTGSDCGAGGGGAWSAVTAGTNANALLVSGSFGPTGSGTVSANNIGAGISLCSGLLCTSTAIPTHTTIQNNEVFLNSTTGNTSYAGSLSPQALAALQAGQVFTLVTDTSSATTATVNINSLGSTTLTLSDGSTAIGTAIVAGQPNWIYYDGSVFRLITPRLSFPSTVFGAASSAGAIPFATGQTASMVIGTCNGSTTISLCKPVSTDLSDTAKIAYQRGTNSYAVDTGTANNYAVALPDTTYTGAVAGASFYFKAANTSSGASNITINGGTARTLYNFQGYPSTTNTIVANDTYMCFDNGTVISAFPISSGVLQLYDGKFSINNSTTPSKMVSLSVGNLSTGRTDSFVDASGSIALWNSETVASSATPTFSSNTGASRIVVTANITSFTLAAGVDGQHKCLNFVHDGTGTAYTVAPPSNVVGLFTIGSTASKRNVQCFTYWITDTVWAAEGPGVINE